MLKHGILGLLNYGDFTGYELMLTFRDSLGYFWDAKTSQIYRELQTLKERGFVTVRIVEQENKPNKKIYSITEAGRTELINWLKNDKFTVSANNPLMMKVFFGGELSASENLEQFNKLKEYCSVYQEKVQSAEAIASSYARMIENKESEIYWKMTIDFGIRYISMLKQWCEDCTVVLEGMK